MTLKRSTKERSDSDPDWESQRIKIIGLGESSMRKSYYPELQQRIRELEDKNRELETAYAEQTAAGEELRQQIDETVKKEQELLQSETKFRDLIETTPDMIWEIDASGVFTYVSPQFREILGYPPEYLEGASFSGLLLPEDIPRIISTFHDHIESGTMLNTVEVTARHKDGSPTELEIRSRRLLDARGNLRGFRGIARNISDRKKAEIALKQSGDRLKRAELIAGTGHWEFHMDTGIAQASDGARSIYGLSGEQWRIADVQKVPLPEYRRMLDEDLRALIAGEQPYDVEFRIRRPTDNAILDIHSVAEYDSRARVIFGVIQDITERKRAEATLRESEKKHRDLVEASPDCIWEVDNAGRFTYLSPKMADILGYEPGTLLGKTFFDVLRPDHVARTGKLFQDAVRDYTGVVSVEVVAQHADGHAVDLEIRAAGATDDQGRLKGFRGISRDITERKKAETALRENESILSSIVENLPIMLFVKDASDLRFVRFNRAGEDLLGYSREEMIGKDDHDLFPSEQADFFTGMDRQVLDGRIPVDIPEETIGTRAWGERVLHTRKIPIISESGQPRFLLGISEDITEQRKAAATLRDSEEMFRSFVRESADGISLIDEKGVVIEWNDAMAGISGISREDAIGALYTDLLVTLMVPEHRTADRVARFRSAADDALLTGSSRYFSKPIEAQIIRRDGNRRVIQQLAFPIRTARGWRVGSMVRDVTEWKSAQDALTMSENKFRNIIEFVPLGVHIYQIGPDGSLVFTGANPAADTILGISHTPLVGKTIEEAFPALAQTRIPKIYHTVAATGEPWQSDEITYKDGRIEGAFSVIAFQIYPGTMVAVFRDVTETKRAAVSLEQARKKMSLLNNVTFQDIQSAAFSLSAYNVLIKQLKPDYKISSFLEKEMVLIRKITSSLDFAKNFQEMGMHPPRWQNVGQTFLFAISHLDFLAISHNLDVENLEVFADPLFEKVFFYLMENVLRHGMSASAVRLWYQEKPEGLVLFVEDNGIGIPQEEKHMIFDRGYGKDAGLGLFLAREILSITGMSIKETGVAGQGTRFEIHIPAGAYRFSHPV